MNQDKRTARASGQGRTRAFTMIETIVVVVLLAIAAGLVASRLRFDPDRQSQAEVERVASLLESAAARAAFTAQKSCVRYTRDGNRLAVEVAAPGDRESFDVQEFSWAPDALEPAVNLEHTVLERGMGDGFPLEPAAWRMEFEGSGRHTSIELVFKNPETNTRWTVALPSSAPRAVVARGADASDAVLGDAIDLDAIGMGDVAW